MKAAMKAWKGIWKAVLGAAILFCLLTEGAAQAADASVVSVAGQTVGIDIGRAAGVRRGNLYLIYADGQERLNHDGSFLGREKHNLAVIKISRVSRASGSGNVISGHAALVQRGHRVEPISARDAKYVSFEEYRPYQPYHPAENWGGGAMPPYSTPPSSMPAYSMPPASMPMPPASVPPSSMPPASMTPPAPPASYPPAWPQRPPHPSYPPYEPPQQAAPVYPQPPQGGYYPNPYPPQNSAPHWPQPVVDPEYIAYMNANYSTDPAAVISTYPLYIGEKNTRRVAHLNARKLRGRDAYAAYADLANSFEGDYLAAYEAGEEARRLRDYANAQFWYETALNINPSYQPAMNGLGRLR